MTTVAKFSERNISNSVALELAAHLLDAGYLVYWHQVDAVQTPTQWLHQYHATQTTYLSDAAYAAYQAEVQAAKGLVTLRGNISAIPRFLTRHTSDGSVPDQDAMPVPLIAVEVGPMQTGRHYELGTALKWRTRHLLLVALARSEVEQSALQDLLGAWFDEDVFYRITDHDAGSSEVVGDVRTTRPTRLRVTIPDDAEALTYQVIVNALLEYIA